ncbi:hypothetical protein [Gluconobacter roseus]|uniref:hypothetical protein n=1 Tax=Gluconobacter roseus TaxID=586239 RepID=UPI0038D0345D
MGHIQTATDELLRWCKATVNEHLVEVDGVKMRHVHERDVFLGLATVLKLENGDV